MNRIITAIQQRLPRRRRRSWRYVSGRRHRVGVAVSALIIVSLYGWWHLTNDRHVEAQAVEYLRQLTGAEVRIHRAKFSLFEGTRLTNVRVFFREDERSRDLFRAKEVLLKHNPFKLLFGGELRVREIVCVDPELTLTQDVDTGLWNCQRIFEGSGFGGARRKASADLPVIRLRGGALFRQEIFRGALVSLGQEKLSGSAVPVPGQPTYKLNIDGDRVRDGKGTLDLHSGEVSWAGQVPLESISWALPRKYRRWYERLRVAGTVKLLGEMTADPGRSRLVAKLVKVSMTLPKADGGLKLAGLAGDLIFDNQGVRIEGVSGRLPELGRANIQLSGAFHGYDADSGFELQIDAKDVRFPLSTSSDSKLGARLKRLKEELDPDGLVAVSCKVARSAGGRITWSGEVTAKKLSLTYHKFPYRVDGVTGTIRFDADARIDCDLTGRRGPAVVKVTGQIHSPTAEPTADPTAESTYDLTIGVTGVPFDEHLRKAMPPSARRAYDQFTLKGVCDATIRVRSPAKGKPPAVSVVVDLTRQASITFKHFPYEMDKAAGQIVIAGRTVVFEHIEGRHGGAEIVLSGMITDTHKPRPDVKVSFTATHVTLGDGDLAKALAKALPKGAYDTFRAFHIRGIGEVVGVIHRPTTGAFQYDLQVALQRAELCYDGFPYPVGDVSGTLGFTPKAVRIDPANPLTGRIAPAGRADDSGRVTVTGEVRLDRDPVAVALIFDAADVPLGPALYSALPSDVQATWRALSLPRPPEPGRPIAATPVHAGTADIRYEMIPGDAPDGSGDGYDLLLKATDATVTWQPFPYTLRGLHGTVRARPGVVHLQQVRAGTDETPVMLDGTIRSSDEKLESLDLSLSVHGLPIKPALLANLPPALKTLTGHLRPGGRCNVVIKELTFGPSPPPASADRAAPPAATAPAGPGRWAVKGYIDLEEAKMDLLPAGCATIVGPISGRIDGSAAWDPGGRRLAVNAEMDLATVGIGPRRITHVLGTIAKAPDTALLSANVRSAKVHGGRITGNAEVELTDAARYGIELEVEGVRLRDLLNAGVTDPDKRHTSIGRLAGWLRLRGGRTAVSRQGTGELQITDAQLGRVPVMLGLANVMYLQLLDLLPARSSFTTAQIKYRLKGQALTFEQIYLAAENTAVLGTGTMHTGTGAINLLFASAPPSTMPGPLGELIGLSIRGLGTYRITGTWRRPGKPANISLKQFRQLLNDLSAPR